MIEFRNVTKIYDGHAAPALEGLDLTIEKGEFVFIMGDSGAGKTTLTKLLLREEKPTSGKVLVDGRNLGKLGFFRLPYYRRKIGVVFQDFRLFPRMTVYENVAFAMRAVGESRRSIARKVPLILSVVGLENKRDRFPAALSGGEQQMLAIGRAMMGKPRMLLLDEPSLGLAPLIINEIFAMVDRIREMGTTILLVEQNARIALKHSDRAYVLETGSIVLSDRADQLLESDEVRKAYFGGL